MRRQTKYPDTDTFRYYNANPKGRLTGDCVYRAIATATGKDYKEVVMEMAKMHCDTGYEATSTKGIEVYLKSLGWTKHKQPKHYDGTKYTGEEFCREVAEDIYNGGDSRKAAIIANIGGHHIVAIMDGAVNDTWNSTHKCIGNYWVKEEEK